MKNLKTIKYDIENPEIWQGFKEAAFALINSGVKHYGSKAIFEHLRYETAIKGNDQFKINNNYTAYYARKFARDYPQFKDFFTMRKTK